MPPPNAGGIGGRGRIATMEEILQMTKFTNNYFHGGTNMAAALTITNDNTTNIPSNNYNT
jgi:hypothetical protein